MGSFRYIPSQADENKDKRGEKEEGDEKKVAGPVDVADGGGRTPLHWAALGDSPEMMRVLIDLGADVKACNENGNTGMRVLLVSVVGCGVLVSGMGRLFGVGHGCRSWVGGLAVI